MKLFWTLPAFIETGMVIQLAGYNQSCCAKSRDAKYILWNHGRDVNRVTRIGKCGSVCVMEDENGFKQLPIP